MAYYWITGLIVCVALAILFIAFRVTKGGMTALYLKGLASIAFVALGCVMFLKFSNFGIKSVFVILGLVCGLVGDVLLDFKVVKKEKSDLFLNLGMLAFGIGHAFYFTFLLQAIPSFNTWALVGSLVTSMLVTTIIMLLGPKLMKLNFGKFKLQTACYSFILSFVMIYAISCAILYSSFWLIALGLSLIFVSDLILSPMYFGDKANDKLYCILNHAIYYLGQIAIALSCLTFIA